MEEIAKGITVSVSHVLEIISAVIIAFAILLMAYQYFRLLYKYKGSLKPPFRGGLEGLRVDFGSSVAVSLELLLGADVLATAVAPSWDDIGKLAAIAVLRTALNYFLGKELKEIHAVKVES
jgi:uncharacterized membrane protein